MSSWHGTGCGLRDISPHCEFWDKRATNLTWEKPKLWSGATVTVSRLSNGEDKLRKGRKGRSKGVMYEGLAGAQSTAGYELMRVPLALSVQRLFTSAGSLETTSHYLSISKEAWWFAVSYVLLFLPTLHVRVLICFLSLLCFGLGWEETAEVTTVPHYCQGNSPTIFPGLVGFTQIPASLGKGKEWSTMSCVPPLLSPVSVLLNFGITTNVQLGQ